MYIKKSTALLCLLSLIAILFYFFWGRLALNGEIEFQFYADSLTYERLYLDNYFSSVFDMIALGGNYLGPMLVLNLFGGSQLLILLFNIFLFYLSLKVLSSIKAYNWQIFVFFIFLSPITFSSLIAVNKEILLVVCLSFLVAYISTKNIIFFILAFLMSFLVRWQLAIYMIMLLYSISHYNPLRKKRLLYVILLLLAISVAYKFLGGSFENVNDVAAQGAITNEGSGLYSLFNELQARGLYFLVFIPKALQAMYGLIFKAGNIFNPINIYNDIFITLHCLFSFLVLLTVFFRNMLKLNNDLVFAAVIYAVVFTLSPIYSPRYFYPVFFLLCAVLSQKADNKDSQKL